MSDSCEKSIERRNRKTEPVQVFTMVLICGLFAIFVYARVSWFYLHFTHYDDIQVAHLTDYTANCFALNFGQYKAAGGIYERIYDLCYFLFHGVYNQVCYAVNFSRYWTYAPGQFILTFALLPFAQSYNGVKFFGRLPSLLNGIIAIFLCWYVLNKITGSKKAAFVGTSALGFSWQSILYCMHMSNYESIILCGFITVLLLIRNLDVDQGSEKRWRLGALILGLMTWMHYQVLCLFCGYVLAYFVYCIKQGTSCKKILYRHMAIGILYGMAVFPLLSFANMKSAASWNAGTEGRFLFVFKFDLIYICKFFIHNTYLVVKAMLSPVSLESGASDLFACFYLALIVLGIVKGFKDHKKKSGLFYLTVLNTGVFLSEILFVLLGKFTLSPTRHCNLLIPVFVMQVGAGCCYLFNYIKNKLYAFLPYAMVGIMCVCFLNGYGQIKEQRIDPFTNEAVAKIVEKYDPDLIIGRHAPQMWYLLDETVYRERELIDYRMDLYGKDGLRNHNKTVMFISSAIPVSSNTAAEISDELVEKGYLAQSEIDRFFSDAECVCSYEQVGEVEFDFYNVGYNGVNNMYYSIYRIK